MRLRIDDPTKTLRSASTFARASTYVVEQTDADTVGVSVLGSARDGGRVDLELDIRAFQDANGDVRVRVVA